MRRPEQLPPRQQRANHYWVFGESELIERILYLEDLIEELAESALRGLSDRIE